MSTRAPLLRPGRHWAQITGTKIVDPDGWRGKDGVTLDTPITFAEYEQRVAESTVGPTDLPHNPWDGLCGQNLSGEPTDERARCSTCRPAPATSKCPRCGSDTCPGRNDLLDCTTSIDGLSARDEARKALRLGLAHAEPLVMRPGDKVLLSLDHDPPAPDVQWLSQRLREQFPEVEFVIGQGITAVARYTDAVESDHVAVPSHDRVLGPEFVTHPDGRHCLFEHATGRWISEATECLREHLPIEQFEVDG